MQIPIELSPDQLARAQQLASQMGYNLSTLIQQWIDRLPGPTPFELPPSPPNTNRPDAARLAAVYKVFSMTPDERSVHHAGVIAQIEEELRKAQSASPQNVGEADWELAAFKEPMNSERRQRGAEPLFDDECSSFWTPDRSASLPKSKSAPKSNSPSAAWPAKRCSSSPVS